MVTSVSGGHKVKAGTPRDVPASFQSILKCAVLLLLPLVNLHKVLRFNLTSNVSSANPVHLGAGRHTFDPLVCNGNSDVLLAALDFGRTNHRLRLCEIQDFRQIESGSNLPGSHGVNGTD